MPLNDKILDTLINGTDSDVVDAAKSILEKSIQDMEASLNDTKLNRTSKNMISSNKSDTKNKPNIATDAQLYTNISEMINGSQTDFGGFSTMMDSLYAKNKKYFSIIKDYEIMPILIPQINRVLMFLVNECLSPDIQNDKTFVIKYTGTQDPEHIQEDIDAIVKEMKLYSLLREVYTNRYKLGREYYQVTDYTETFDHMLDMMKKKRMNETTAAMSDIDYLDSQYQNLTSTINEASCTAYINTATNIPDYMGTRAEKETYINETAVPLNFTNLNIRIERSSITKYVEEAHAELLAETYSQYSLHNMIHSQTAGRLNEDVIDNDKLEQLVTNMKKKKLQRCMIIRLDPAKVFKLKIGGKIIGYFHVTDINENTSNIVNFAQSLKDQLLKSRATNLTTAAKSAEEVISKELAERIINTFDPNIGINRIEDIDLLHDYVLNNEIYKGNKRIVFYYEDEIFDMSRADDSILTNGVFFTKLYSTLLLNNIMTKVLRGRGRQIHTVRLGASPSVQRYIQNAMASLTMPENNLGTLHGSFEQILNPFNSASDIVIPTEEDNDRYITTDYIPGQDVDMNDDFLRTLLNAIVSSFGLDSAVIDATNGNLQFARTLTMESLQISNNIKNEQQDLHDSWEAFCLRILRIMGNEETIHAIDQNQIEVSFFEPKSLIIQNTIDDLNNAKNLADAIADVIPEFNDEDSEKLRNRFIFNMVKKKTNMDWTSIETLINDTKLAVVNDDMNSEIKSVVKEYKDNTKEVTYGDMTGDGIVSEEDQLAAEEEENPEDMTDTGEEDYDEF